MSRLSLALFLIFYTAYEVTVGLGTGVLVDYANGLPPAEQAAVAAAIQDSTPTTSLPILCRSRLSSASGWVVALVAVAVELQACGSGLGTDGARRALRSVLRPPAAGRPAALSLRRGRRVDRRCRAGDPEALQARPATGAAAS